MKHTADWSPSAGIRVLQSIDKTIDKTIDAWFRAWCLPFAFARTANSLRERGTDATAATFRTCRLREGRLWSGSRSSAGAAGMRFAVDRRSASRAPDEVGLAARRTRRVTDSAGFLGHAVGGRPAHRLTARLGLTTSRDTILRALKGAPQPASTALRFVGIDD